MNQWNDFQDDNLRPVADWSGYFVSKDGSVWSHRDFHGGTTAPPHQLSPRPDKDGYLSVTLNNKGKRKTCKVAHLVLEAFVGPRPEGAVSCHWPDSDVGNNQLANLRWATQAENISDKLKAESQARGVSHGMVKLTEDDVRSIRSKYVYRMYGYAKLAEEFGVSAHQIWLIVKRKNWKHVN